MAIVEKKIERRKTVLIVASSDMNHYESDAVTRVKDRKAIERVLALDARGLWEVVMNEDISMCGFGPTIVMLTAAKLLGATSATLVKYATSGEVSGDYDQWSVTQESLWSGISDEPWRPRLAECGRGRSFARPRERFLFVRMRRKRSRRSRRS